MGAVGPAFDQSYAGQGDMQNFAVEDCLFPKGNKLHGRERAALSEPNFGGEPWSACQFSRKPKIESRESLESTRHSSICHPHPRSQRHLGKALSRAVGIIQSRRCVDAKLDAGY